MIGSSLAPAVASEMLLPLSAAGCSSPAGWLHDASFLPRSTVPWRRGWALERRHVPHATGGQRGGSKMLDAQDAVQFLEKAVSGA